MALLTMKQEPETRFIDMFQFDQNMAERRDRFGGGTSLPLNSDGYEEKQTRLREERHQDWLRQQERDAEQPHTLKNPLPSKIPLGPHKPADYEEEIQKMTDRYHSRYNEVIYHAHDEPNDAVYYRVGPPEQGFPGLGSYEKQRHEMNIVRQKEYNDLLKKQRLLEMQRVENLHKASPRQAQPPGFQMDYNASSEKARAEEKRAYQDYMGVYQHPSNIPVKPPLDYEENRKVLNEERKREYNQFMEKKAKEERYWQMRGRPVTPPGGLNIGNYDRQLKEQATQKKKEYKDMLDQQKNEQLKIKAWDRIAEISPGYVKYREEERPLVGSPRDINYHLHEKGSEGQLGKGKPNRDTWSTYYANTEQKSLEEDPNHKAYYEIEKAKHEYKRKYAEELLKQQREHLYIRARQEPEISVMDRNTLSQYPVNKPPPGPGYRPRDEAPPGPEYRPRDDPLSGPGFRPRDEPLSGPGYKPRDEQTRQTPKYWNEGRRAGSPLSFDTDVPRSKRSSAGYNKVPWAFKTDFQPVAPKTEKIVNGPSSLPAFESEEPRLFEQPRMPRSRRSLKEEEKRYTPSKSEVEPFHQISPRRLKNTLYQDSEEVSVQRREANKTRQQEYNEYLQRKSEEQRRREETKQHQLVKPTEVVKNPHYSSDNYESYQRELQKKQGEEYKEYLSKKFQPPPGQMGLPLGQYKYEPKRLLLEFERNKELNEIASSGQQFEPSKSAQGLPIGQYRYEPRRLAMELERNKEYNELLKKGSPNRKPRDIDGPQGLNIDIMQQQRKQIWLEKQRNQDYNEYLKKRSLRQKAPTPPELQGLPIGQQHYEPIHKAMENQRNKEYNDFLKKKYGNLPNRTTRSEPDVSNRASFFYGNDSVQDEKRKTLEEERKNEYNQFIKEQAPARSRSIDIPSDADSGLPIGQHHHETWRKFLREQRNREYNQLVDMKSLEKPHRDWNFDQDGILELRGDDAIQSKQRELRAERQKDYNSYISQHKVQVNRTWPEPDDKGALLVQKGEYEGVRQMYDEQRKKDFLESLKHRREMGLMLTPPSVTPEPIKARYPYFNPMIYSLGHYENIQKKLVEVRKKEFQDYLNQRKTDTDDRQYHVRSAPILAGEETPLIHLMGLYEQDTKKRVLDERKKDFANYVKQQQKNWTPRNTVRENMMPHMASAETPIVSYMGKYDQEQVKFKMERNKDMHEYSEKKKQELHNPYSHYVYPTVAVAENPVVEHMGHDIEKKKQDLREQRKHDYEQYMMQQRVMNPSRRHEFVDTSSGPYNGLFQGLGEHGNTTELLNQQRKQEYNDQLTQKGVPHGRPNWARDTLSNKSDVGLSSVRNPPPSDNYQQILEEKRREEANRRRFDDPEYQGRLVQADNSTTRYGY